MEGLGAEEASDVGLKLSNPSTELDFGYSSFQNNSSHSAEVAASPGCVSTDKAPLNLSNLGRQDESNSGMIEDLKHKNRKHEAFWRPFGPIFATPLSRPDVVLTRSSTSLSIRPRTLTCTSTPRSSSPIFCRGRHISLGSSPNYESQSISSFDSAYSSGLSVGLPGTSTSVGSSNVSEENSREVHHSRGEDQEILLPLHGAVMEAPFNKSVIQLEQNLCCHQKMTSYKFLSVSSPCVAPEKSIFHSPKWKNKLCSKIIPDTALSSTPVAFGSNKQLKVSKSALDISYSHNFELNDLSMQQQAKQPHLSLSFPDLSPSKSLLSYPSFMSDQIEDLTKSYSLVCKGVVNSDSTENFISKLQNYLDEAPVPRTGSFNRHETFNPVDKNLQKETSSSKDIGKVKRRLALDLSKSNHSLDEETSEAEYMKHKLSPDDIEQDKTVQAVNVQCKVSLEPQISTCIQSQITCEVSNLPGKSLVSAEKYSRHRELSSLNMVHGNSNPVVEVGSPLVSLFEEKCLSKTNCAPSIPTANACSAQPSFESVPSLAGKEAERFRSNTILLLLLDRASYLLPSILSHLSPEDILSFSQVSRKCRGIVSKSKPLTLKVNNFKQSQLTAVSAIGKENLVYRHKNCYCDPDGVRRVLGQVNKTVKSFPVLFEPPVRGQLGQRGSYADELVPFNNENQSNVSLSALRSDKKGSFNHHLLVQSKDGSHNLQTSFINNCSSNSKFQGSESCSEVISAKRMFACNPRLYISKGHTTHRNTMLNPAASLKRDDFKVSLSAKSEMNRKSTASKMFSTQCCKDEVHHKSEKLQASPLKIMGAIQSAVSSIQATVSPRKYAAKESSPSKEKKSSRRFNVDCYVNNKELESVERSSSCARLPRCNLLNHANKVMSQRSISTTLPKSNSEENPSSFNSRCIVLDPSPIKCPPKKLIFSKAAKKQLRRL